MNRIENIINNLLGTKQSLTGLLLTKEELNILNERIFKCESCGFWCKSSEKNDLCGDLLCGDCVYLEVYQD